MLFEDEFEMHFTTFAPKDSVGFGFTDEAFPREFWYTRKDKKMTENTQVTVTDEQMLEAQQIEVAPFDVEKEETFSQPLELIGHDHVIDMLISHTPETVQ